MPGSTLGTEPINAAAYARRVAHKREAEFTPSHSLRLLSQSSTLRLNSLAP